jgi:hypothetical protein
VGPGLEQRVTLDIDVLPASRFVEADLRRACAVAELGFNPSNKDLAEQDYIEVVPEETLVLPRPDPIAFLIDRFRLTEADLEESFARLPERFKADPVVQDNLRYIKEDYL